MSRFTKWGEHTTRVSIRLPDSIVSMLPDDRSDFIAQATINALVARVVGDPLMIADELETLCFGHCINDYNYPTAEQIRGIIGKLRGEQNDVNKIQ